MNHLNRHKHLKKKFFTILCDNFFWLAEIQVLAKAIPFSRLRDEKELQKILVDLQNFHRGMFVDLGIIRQNGTQVAYAGPFKLNHADYADAIWFQEVMRKKSNISDVFTGLRDTPHFIVAVLLDADGEKWINPIYDSLNQSGLFPENTFFFFVAERSFVILVFS